MLALDPGAVAARIAVAAVQRPDGGLCREQRGEDLERSAIARHLSCTALRRRQPQPMDIERIDARQARAHMTNGDALLVCAYDSQEKFLNNHLGGALSLEDLQALEDDLPRAREIIFYCA